ncbi:UNVERIFIED_CONTAM: DNA-directed RNA polymerase II subunit [Sesamum radiatum]|uniref:DNA-directed RNA polymerase II subunit n=1 Tax=Sesamum radiatum TaxID=300843 RepID=A0AAW2W6M9_SESRA
MPAYMCVKIVCSEFLKAKCLMNCEVALILEHKYEQLQQMADDPMNQMSQVFEKSLQYVKRFSRYKNPDAVRQVREYPSVICAKIMLALKVIYVTKLG